jgi:hypothetical protein
VRFLTAPTPTLNHIYLPREPLSGLLAKYLCLPELAQETYSTTPVGAINRVDNEGDRYPSNRTGTQHLPYILSEKTT